MNFPHRYGQQASVSLGCTTVLPPWLIIATGNLSRRRPTGEWQLRE